MGWKGQFSSSTAFPLLEWVCFPWEAKSLWVMMLASSAHAYWCRTKREPDLSWKSFHCVSAPPWSRRARKREVKGAKHVVWESLALWVDESTTSILSRTRKVSAVATASWWSHKKRKKNANKFGQNALENSQHLSNPWSKLPHTDTHTHSLNHFLTAQTTSWVDVSHWHWRAYKRTRKQKNAKITRQQLKSWRLNDLCRSRIF